MYETNAFIFCLYTYLGTDMYTIGNIVCLIIHRSGAIFGSYNLLNICHVSFS